MTNLDVVLLRLFAEIGEPFPDKDYFKKLGWYKDHSWTEEQERNYINWLAEFLMKNWKGITLHKPYNKKQAMSMSIQFVSNYGWITK